MLHKQEAEQVHMAIDTRKHLLAVQVTPAIGQERAQVRSLTQDVPHATGEAIKIAFVDQGYTGQEPAQAAKDDGIPLHVTTRQEAKQERRFLATAPLGLSSTAWDGSVVSDGCYATTCNLGWLARRCLQDTHAGKCSNALSTVITRSRKDLSEAPVSFQPTTDNRNNLHQAQCWFVSKSMAEVPDRGAYQGFMWGTDDFSSKDPSSPSILSGQGMDPHTCGATENRRNAGTPSKALMSRCRRP
ncbi:transposase [Xanthomonas pisi]|uniref:transposase n=1 Tax=Xanthomonas pisi TaxID=56457 RepID=UPI0011AFDE11|nr:transposase [Xanthomonas pisi]